VQPRCGAAALWCSRAATPPRTRAVSSIVDKYFNRGPIDRPRQQLRSTYLT
jgi:hypothetical protein